MSAHPPAAAQNRTQRLRLWANNGLKSGARSYLCHGDAGDREQATDNQLRGSLPASKARVGKQSAERNRKDPICLSPYLDRARNLIERCFNKIKQCWRVATRYDELAATLWRTLRVTPAMAAGVPDRM
jgi:hypothetical protein